MAHSYGGGGGGGYGGGGGGDRGGRGGLRPGHGRVQASAASATVSGIDRGLLAVMDTSRQGPRQLFDPAGPYARWDLLAPHVRDARDLPQPEPHSAYRAAVLPALVETGLLGGGGEAEALCTRHVQTMTNKAPRSPVTAVCFRPDASHIITGSAAAELTLWFGDMWNFDTIIKTSKPGQPIYAFRAMHFTRSGEYMMVGDDAGKVFYWTPFMSCQNSFQAHGAGSQGGGAAAATGVDGEGEAVTALAIAPSDAKVATAGNDGLVKVWDFWSTGLEHVLAGHKAGATGVSWHPHKASERARARERERAQRAPESARGV